MWLSFNENPPAPVTLVNIKAAPKSGITHDVKDDAGVLQIKARLAVKLLDPLLAVSFCDRTNEFRHCVARLLIGDLETLVTQDQAFHMFELTIIDDNVTARTLKFAHIVTVTDLSRISHSPAVTALRT